MASQVPKLEPLKHFIGQLDLSEYGSKSDILKAARALRARRKRQLDDERKVERDIQGECTEAAKRMKVRAGTHRWCRGWGGCGGRGYLVGKDGTVMRHGPCRGDGLVKIGGGGGRARPVRGRGRGRARGRARSRPRSTAPRRRRGRKAAVGLAGLGTLWTVLGQTLGTVGQVAALVVIVVVVVIKVVAYVLRGVAAVAR